MLRPRLLAVVTCLSASLVAVGCAATEDEDAVSGESAQTARPRPDTEHCAEMRRRDPGGLCTPKGEYLTPERVYLPDGRIIDRTIGNPAPAEDGGA